MSAPGVRVRMYNVGFGDCFLVFIPSAGRDLKVLIDCGTHPQGRRKQPLFDEVMKQLLADVCEDGAPRIDVVVATHRHQDHVSGFADSAWNEVQVSEVWMPWTEDRQNPDAQRIREVQSRSSRHLMELGGRLDATKSYRSTILALAQNSETNAKAFMTLHDGFAGHPVRRFLPPGDRAACSLEVPCLPGVRVHALGPARDPEVIRDMEPPPESSYLAAVREGTKAEGPPLFHSFWKWTKKEIEEKEAQDKDEKRENFRLLTAVSGYDLKRIDKLNDREQEDLLGVAVQLERAVNGTSLVLVLQIGQACLLFPGDAQWGAWRHVLSDPEWRELLTRTTFYKVSHHGSHNATPVELVETFAQDAVTAMVSTLAMGRWPQIPRPSLLKALANKCAGRVVRSDWSDLKPPELLQGLRANGNLYTELEIPF